MLLDYLQDIMKCQQNLYWVELYKYRPLCDALKVKTKFHDISIRTYMIIYLALYNVVIMKVIENAAKLKCFFHPLPSYAKKTSLKHHNRFICRLWNIHLICFPHNKKIKKINLLKSFWQFSTKDIDVLLDMGTTFQKWINTKLLRPNSPLKSQIRV